MFRSQVCLFLLFLEQLTQAQMTPPCFAINKWTERPSQAIWNSATGVGVGSLWSEQSDTHKSAASLVPAAGSKSLIYWSHLTRASSLLPLLQTAPAINSPPSRAGKVTGEKDFERKSHLLEPFISFVLVLPVFLCSGCVCLQPWGLKVMNLYWLRGG